MPAEAFVAIAGAIATLTTGALIKVVQMFLRSQAARDGSWQDALREQREVFEMHFTNHTSQTTNAMKDVAASLRDLAGEVRYYRVSSGGSRVETE